MAIRDKMLERASRLKDIHEKDSHPGVRREWKRMRDAEEEKRKSSNVGCNIPLDFSKRVLYKDNVMMERW